MNLEKLFKMQKELDNHILERFPNLKNEDLLPKKILALQVELGELAQNWRGFKFWSEDQEPRNYEKCYVCNGHGQTMVPAFPTFEEMDMDICPSCQGEGTTVKNPLLEEYVDCLHFILSIGNETIKKYGMELKENLDMNIWREKNENTVNKFNILFASVSSLYMSTIDEFYDFEDMTGIYSEVFEEFIQLGQMLDFTWEQIEQAYLDKNKVNHARQESGY